MAKTLVIRNADYSANKLTTVSIPSEPCAGISLDYSTASLTSIGATKQLAATTLPSGITYLVTWRSSNTNVVTVSSSGLVTCVGVGSANVIVSCGAFSATCTFTCTATMDKTIRKHGYRIAGNALDNSQNGLAYFATYSDFGFICGANGSYGMYNAGVPDDFSTKHYTPYDMPKNTSVIEIAVPTGMTLGRIQWYNKATTCVADNATYAAVINQQTSFNSPVNNVYTVEVPTIQGYQPIDQLSISLTKTDFADTDFGNVTVTFK